MSSASSVAPAPLSIRAAPQSGDGAAPTSPKNAVSPSRPPSPSSVSKKRPAPSPAVSPVASASPSPDNNRSLRVDASDSKSGMAPHAPMTTPPPRIPVAQDENDAPNNSSSSNNSAGESIDPQDLTLLKVIGRGTFAQQVALARHRQTSGVFVVKTLDKQTLVQRKQVVHTLAEKRVLQAVDGHPFIVKLVSAFQTDHDLNFVLEYCQGGELFFHLQHQRQQKFGEDATRFYAAEVLAALADLHAHGVVYRDLKPENVLLDAEGHVKLADFGFAKQDMGDGRRTYSFCGSPEYLSPEMVAKDGHGLETDLWSFGCFLYELLTGSPPFQSDNMNRLFTMIKQGRVWFPPYLSGHARALIEGLMRVDPAKRLTAAQAKQHPFFRAVDWDELLQRRVAPPIVPDCAGAECTRNFDDGFTSAPVKALRLRTTSDLNKRLRRADDDWQPVVRTLSLRPVDDFEDF